MKQFDKAIFSLFLILVTCFAVAKPAFAQSSRPLSDILEDWQGYAWSDIVDIATWEAQNDGPLYPSAPATTPHYENFEGSFTPSDANTKLAIFSDDGCDVFIDGVKVHSGKGRAQALPNLSQSLHQIAYSFQAGQTYQIRVEYSNTVYQGAADIDGASMFAYTGGNGTTSLINVSSNKTSICAGGISSFPHQAEIKVVAKHTDGSFAIGKIVSFSSDTLLPGSPSALSPDDPDADLRATISPFTATTNARGVARATLTSSKQIGARVIVKASFDDNEDQTEPILMEDADGEMSIDTDTLEADGQSQANVYLALDYSGDSVSGHGITFYIVSVEDANGNPVEPAADGSFPGYGNITTVQGATDESGVAYGTYTAGTLPGTITFASDDNSLYINSPIIAKNGFGAKFSQVSYSPGVRMAQAETPSRHPRRRTKSGAGGARPVARVSMNFVRIYDQNGNTATPVFTPTTAVAAANKIWYPRAQVQFYIKNNVVFGRELVGNGANIIDWPSMPAIHQRVETDLRDVLNKPLASLTLYFCKEILSNPRGRIGGRAAHGGPYIMLQDGNAYIAASVLSHELGHSLNEPHIVELRGDGTENPRFIYLRPNLMYPRSYNGEALNTEQRDRANAFARANFR